MKRFPCGLSLIASLLYAPTARSGDTFIVTGLGTLGGGASVAYGINNNGQVVGRSTTSAGAEHAFVWDVATGIRDIGTLGGPTCIACAINDLGEAVGWSTTPDGIPRAFIWDEVAGIKEVAALAGKESKAYAINNSRNIAGWFGTEAYPQNHAFVVSGGTLVDLGFMYDAENNEYLDNAFAYGINDRSQVVGENYSDGGRQFAFLWQNGELIDLWSPWSQRPSRVAFAVNDVGQVVGRFDGGGHAGGDAPHDGYFDYTGVVWDGTTRISIGTLGGSWSDPWDINNLGVVVGRSATQGGQAAFVWQNNTIVNLNDLLPPGSGWYLTEAAAINDAGVIAGSGMKDGKTQAYVLAPVKPVLSVANASVKWTKKRAFANVDLEANFTAPVPAAGDTIAVTFDGVSLFSAPMSAFVQDRSTGVYSWQKKKVSVSIDFVAGKIGVQSGQTPMTEFDVSDGVDVDLRLGVLHAIQKIIMIEAHGGRLVYQRPSTP